MSTSLLTPSIIAMEGLFQLENNTVMAGNVYTEYRKEFVKIGDTVTIRKPVKFASTSGATLQRQDVQEGSTSIVISTRKHVGWAFVSQDLTLTIDKYSERYIKPAGIRLANDVDTSLTGLYSSLWMSAGTPGTTPNAFSTLGDMATVLDNGAVPDDGDRKLVLNPAARWSMADALKGIYDNSMPRDMVRKGLLGQLANFEIYGDQNVARHTTGTRTGDTAVLVNGNNQHSNTTPTANSQAAFSFKGFTADSGSVKAGDVFTIASVYAVNPVSKVSTGQLQRFVIVSDSTTPSSGIATATISPAIVTTGAYQNVDSAPVDGAAVTFMGAASTVYPQNLAFHKNALALVTVPLILPDGATFKARVQNGGISIRVVKDYSIIDDEDIIRLDIMYGVKAIYPDLGGRLWG